MSAFFEDVIRTYDKMSGNMILRLLNCLRIPGVKAMAVFRFGQWISEKPFTLRVIMKPVYHFLNYRIRTKWGIEIGGGAQIGGGLYIAHHGCIFINSGTRIGKNCAISQGVTIGASGEGEKRGCPVIGNDVYVAPGAKIYGKISIGDNVKIGPNAVVHDDIPENAVVVLSPGYKILNLDGNRK